MQFLQSNWRKFFLLLNFLSDTLSIFMSSFVAYFISNNYFNSVVTFDFRILVFTILSTTVFIFVYLVIGLYRATYHNAKERIYSIFSKSYLISLIIIFSSFYIFKIEHISRIYVFLFFTCMPLIFLMFRSMLNSLNLYLQKKGYGIQNILITNGNSNLKFLERFLYTRELGYEVKGIIEKDKKKKINSKIKTYSISELNEIIEKEKIKNIFITSESFSLNGYSEILKIDSKHKVSIKILSDKSEKLLRFAHIYDIVGIPIVIQQNIVLKKINDFFKRVFDILVSIILIVLFSPIFLFLIVFIFLEDGKPIFFIQKRTVSKNGKQFNFYKFRSMIKNAENFKDDLLDFNETDGILFKIKNDPRLTKVGKFIRKFSIDELPQLMNVLKGEMSFVGPRPLPISDFERIENNETIDEIMKLRKSIKPGITGLWQISGRSETLFEEMLILDLYYMEYNSLIFDIEILIETIPRVLFGKGSY